MHTSRVDTPTKLSSSRLLGAETNSHSYQPGRQRSLKDYHSIFGLVYNPKKSALWRHYRETSAGRLFLGKSQLRARNIFLYCSSCHSNGLLHLHLFRSASSLNLLACKRRRAMSTLPSLIATCTSDCARGVKPSASKGSKSMSAPSSRRKRTASDFPARTAKYRTVALGTSCEGNQGARFA